MMNTIEELARAAMPKLMKYLIYKNDDDTYVLFEEYSLHKSKDIVTLFRYRDEKKYTFNKLRNATAWAVLDKYNKFYEANRVHELDSRLESIQVHKHIHGKLAKSSNLDDYTIQTHKLQNDLLREKQFRDELDKYIIMANNCQQRGFENELKRSARE